MCKNKNCDRSKIYKSVRVITSQCHGRKLDSHIHSGIKDQGVCATSFQPLLIWSLTSQSFVCHSVSVCVCVCVCVCVHSLFVEYKSWRLCLGLLCSCTKIFHAVPYFKKCTHLPGAPLILACLRPLLAFLPVTLPTLVQQQKSICASRIDGSTSRSADVTNMAVFWSKRSSKKHCSQWEP